MVRWRSLEEADAGGEWLSGERRREATARTRSDLSSDAVNAASAGEVDAFLSRRSEWLLSQTARDGSKIQSAFTQMAASGGKWVWAIAGWIAVLAAGFALTGIGAEREINLLALPLVGLLLWNAVIIMLSLALEFSTTGRRQDAGLLVKWIAGRLSHFQSTTSAGGESALEGAARRKFHEFVWPMAIERLKSSLRAWLHIAAAILAIGSGLGMYAKGWSREYRAVWESTLLAPRQAESFFNVLFGPASKVFRLPLPVRGIEAMQRTAGATARPADALPWINLYAGTLVLFIVLPRVLLAGLTGARRNQRVAMLWGELGWQAYAKRLLRAVEGGDEVVMALLHGISGWETEKDRWTQAIQELVGGRVRVAFQTLASGDEDEFTGAFEPPSHVLVMIFQLATTPEEEVQRRLVGELRRSLRKRFADGKLLVLLDGTSVGGRWTPDHVRSHRALWSQLLAGDADQIEFVNTPDSVNYLPAAMSKAV